MIVDEIDYCLYLPLEQQGLVVPRIVAKKTSHCFQKKYALFFEKHRTLFGKTSPCFPAIKMLYFCKNHICLKSRILYVKPFTTY